MLEEADQEDKRYFAIKYAYEMALIMMLNAAMTESLVEWP
jgi:hypothetical protein